MKFRLEEEQDGTVALVLETWQALVLLISYSLIIYAAGIGLGFTIWGMR